MHHRKYADRSSRRSRSLLTVISIAKHDLLESGEASAGIEQPVFNLDLDC